LNQTTKMSIHRLRQESLDLLEKLRIKTKELRTQIRGAGVNLQGVNIDSYLDLVVEFLNGTKETFHRDEERIKRFKEDEDEIVEELQRLTVEEDEWEEKFRKLKTKMFNAEHEKEAMEIRLKDLQRELDRTKLTSRKFVKSKSFDDIGQSFSQDSMTRPRRITWADQLPLKRMPGDGWRLPRSSSESAVAAMKKHSSDADSASSGGSVPALTKEEINEILQMESARSLSADDLTHAGVSDVSETSWIDAKNDEDMGSSSMKGGAAIDEDFERNLTEELPVDRVLPNPDAKRQPSPKKESGGTEIPMTPPPKSTDAVRGSEMLQKAAPRRPKLKKSRSVTRMWNAMKRKFVKKNKPFKDKTIQHANATSPVSHI